MEQFIRRFAAAAVVVWVSGCVGDPDDVNFDEAYGEYTQEARVSACTRSAILAGTPDNRRAIMERAMNWVDRGVMYSQTPQRSVGGYRTDCSGFVSMCWGLPTPGNTTYSFAGGPWDNNRSRRISWSELEVGDALNNPQNHIVLFAGWLDEAHTRFCSVEEYNWGRPASIIHHTINDISRGRRYRDAYLPIRFTSTPPNTPASALGSNGGGGSTGSGGSSGGSGSSGGASCMSHTLGRWVPTDTCVESRFDRSWYQCVNGYWRSGRNVSGPCASQHPLTSSGNSECFSTTLGRNVREGTCLQSRLDSWWYQCTDTGWVYDSSLPGSRRGPIGTCSSVVPL